VRSGPVRSAVPQAVRPSEQLPARSEPASKAYPKSKAKTCSPRVARIESVNDVRMNTLAGCEICKGEPFIEFPNGWDRCTCARGQALRQMDRQRSAKKNAA
jgi:hypothetical protein